MNPVDLLAVLFSISREIPERYIQFQDLIDSAFLLLLQNTTELLHRVLEGACLIISRRDLLKDRIKNGVYAGFGIFLFRQSHAAVEASFLQASLCTSQLQRLTANMLQHCFKVPESFWRSARHAGKKPINGQRRIVIQVIS